MEKEAIELLKEVLSLHGWKGYGYPNGLIERWEIYLETENGGVKEYKHSCDARMMEEIDEKIKKVTKKVAY